MKIWVGLYVVMVFFSCGKNKRQFEEHHLPASGALILNEKNHPHGYAEAQCFYCHVKANIHRDNTTGSPLIETARELTEQQGILSCSTCHGANGL